MIACPRCKTALEDNAKFCGSCGNRLDGRPTGAPQTSQKPVAAQGKIDPLAQTLMSGPGQMSEDMRRSIEMGRAGIPQGASAPPQSQARMAAPDVQTFVPQPPAPAPLAPGQDRLIGTVLNGRYRVEQKLGEGGFGAVYRGTQLNMNREVALKVLHHDLKGDANLVARFKREAQASCALRDAHTITTFDFDQSPDGTMYIAMELLKGKSIHAVAKESGPLPWPRVVKILEQMCSSLGEAHGQGIVHRDIKPENIYLEKRPGNDDFVKVLDFGIAKIVKGDASSNQNPQLTAMGQTLGTLEYMSPEQLMGQMLDGRSDIYAMGVLGYEMLTGQLPFPHARSPGVLITAQLRETPPMPSGVRPQSQIPRTVDAAIMRMLGKKKEERFADVHALRAELQNLLSTGGSGVMPAQVAPDARGSGAMPAAGPPMSAMPHGSAPQIASAQQSMVSGAAIPAKPAGKSNTPLIIIAALLVVGIAIALVFALK